MRIVTNLTEFSFYNSPVHNFTAEFVTKLAITMNLAYFLRACDCSITVLASIETLSGGVNWD